MMEFVALKRTTQLLNQEHVACHVCIFCVPVACALLDHQIGVTITQNQLDVDLFCQFDTMDKRFILGDVVGCRKVELQDIMKLVILGRGENNSSTQTTSHF